MATVTPKRGTTFVHARQLTEAPGKPVKEWPHAVCRVTRVTANAVYFRNETGFLSYVDRDKFSDIVLEVT